jgi:hypothetical protein
MAKQGAEIRSDRQTFLPLGAVSRRLQLVLGNDRAAGSLDNLERLENRPLCEELGVILRALTVVAAARILGWKMTDGGPSSGPRTAAGRPPERCLLR